MSSLLSGSSGPGGLTGGDFTGDANSLMGHDFSADLVGSSVGGVYSGNTNAGSGSKGQGQYGTDTARFDTSQYQNMLDQLFNPDTYDKELLASPFHGETPEAHSGNGQGQGQGQGYQTSHESSMGSYASTDMSSSTYSGNSGSYQSNGGSFGDGSAVSSHGSGAGHSVGSSGIAHSSFDAHHFLTGGSSSTGSGSMHTSSGSHSGLNLDSPFKISGSSNGESPFKITSSGGQGKNPFDTSSFMTGGSGGTVNSNTNFQSMSGGQSYQGGDDLQGTSQFQGNSISANKNGLDQYGNVDFSRLSGSTGTVGSQYGSVGAAGSGLQYTGGSLTGSKPSYNGVNTGVSESQFKTPFESDNYNDLLGNPFESSSSFSSDHETLNQPFNGGPDQSGGLQQYQGSSGTSGSAGVPSYLGSSGYGQSNGYGQGPAGDPFRQGGSRMG